MARIRFALRTARRHPVYSVINLIGLAVGIATFILVILFVREERRFDRFHEHADRIVRVTGHYSDETGTRSFARTSPAIAPTLEMDFPDVVHAVRLQRWKGPVRSDDRQFNEQQMFMVDPAFFDVFSFKVLRGDPKRMLSDRMSAVITTSTARRYFDEVDPIGRELVFADSTRLTVTGVVADPPAHSHIQFALLLPMDLIRDGWARRGRDLDNTWTAATFYTYLLLADADRRSQLESELDGFIARHTGNADDDGVAFEMKLQPLTDIHLKSDLRQEMGPNGSESNILVFLAIAALVLIISCVNFVNLATAWASKRNREVGVKKALGAARTQLVGQFLGEAILTTLAALLIALALVERITPWFNSMTGSSISLSTEFTMLNFVELLALVVGVGLLAGTYPALVLSGVAPARALRDSRSGRSGSRSVLVRRSLVAFQFFLSIAILASTALAWKQTNFMRNSRLGFDDHVLVMPYYWDSVVTSRFSTLKEELSGLDGVKSVTASGDVPGRMFTSMSYWIEGMPEEERAGINALIVEPDFVETYDLEIAAGRDFSPGDSTVLASSFILNETAVRELGLTNGEVINRTLEMNTRGPVVGVVKDFHFEGLQNRVEPLVMTVWPDWFGYVSVALEGDEIDRTLAQVQSVWSTVLPNRPFEFFFLDQDFELQYRKEQRFGEVFAVLAFLAIFITSIGLFGLAAFTAEQKTKEIGIRRVFGASVARIVGRINREFVALVLIGGVLSIPLSWIAMEQWLQNFAYRVEFGGMIFVTSLIAVGAIGLLPVCYHTVRAALADPVESLRYE